MASRNEGGERTVKVSGHVVWDCGDWSHPIHVKQCLFECLSCTARRFNSRGALANDKDRSFHAVMRHFYARERIFFLGTDKDMRALNQRF